MLKILKDNESDSTWYSKGLNFKCTECGKCCTGAPGYVWITEAEMATMANFLKLSVKDFSCRYVRRVNGRFSLTENTKTYDCVFLKNNRCQVYGARPTQCRTFPWWPQNLKSRNDWEEAAQFCEGIQLNAPLVPIETIREQLAIQKEASSDGYS
jgi:Fe-S-cluster containining protein